MPPTIHILPYNMEYPSVQVHMVVKVFYTDYLDHVVAFMV